jgi:hypothetical protein
MITLNNFLGTIAKFEKDSIALENARLAIAPEQEHREVKQPELTGDQQPVPKEKKSRKKKIDLSKAPGDGDDASSTEEKPQ